MIVLVTKEIDTDLSFVSLFSLDMVPRNHSHVYISHYSYLSLCIHPWISIVIRMSSPNDKHTFDLWDEKELSAYYAKPTTFGAVRIDCVCMCVVVCDDGLTLFLFSHCIAE